MPMAIWTLSFLSMQHHGSIVRKDVKMKLLLYFIISPEGSLRSQIVHSKTSLTCSFNYVYVQALLNALETAANDDELEAIVMYIAMLANPQPQMVNTLEKLLSSDVHSTDSLLLAYSAIIPKTSPELHQEWFSSSSIVSQRPRPIQRHSFTTFSLSETLAMPKDHHFMSTLDDACTRSWEKTQEICAPRLLQLPSVLNYVTSCSYVVCLFGSAHSSGCVVYGPSAMAAT